MPQLPTRSRFNDSLPPRWRSGRTTWKVRARMLWSVQAALGSLLGQQALPKLEEGPRLDLGLTLMCGRKGVACRQFSGWPFEINEFSEAEGCRACALGITLNQDP